MRKTKYQYFKEFTAGATRSAGPNEYGYFLWADGEGRVIAMDRPDQNPIGGTEYYVREGV